MRLYDIVTTLSARLPLFERMLLKFGAGWPLKSPLADVEEPLLRCKACWHEDDSCRLMAANLPPSELPDFCRKRDLSARLSWEVGDRRPD